MKEPTIPAEVTIVDPEQEFDQLLSIYDLALIGWQKSLRHENGKITVLVEEDLKLKDARSKLKSFALANCSNTVVPTVNVASDKQE